VVTVVVVADVVVDVDVDVVTKRKNGSLSPS
jgi:hypothetical protein